MFWLRTLFRKQKELRLPVKLCSRLTDVRKQKGILHTHKTIFIRSLFLAVAHLLATCNRTFMTVAKEKQQFDPKYTACCQKVFRRSAKVTTWQGSQICRCSEFYCIYIVHVSWFLCCFARIPVQLLINLIIYYLFIYLFVYLFI
jgi:hypothetical protein